MLKSTNNFIKIMAAKPSHSIPVGKFQYGGDIDFDEWIQTFEEACKAATHPVDDATEWLPLKLDAQTLALFRQKTVCPEVKEEMRKLLADPHEAFKWKANPKAFLWDGKTPLHMVAAHIKSKVEKKEKGLNGNSKKEADSFRFRQVMANFPEYRSAIDLACRESNQTIEKDIRYSKAHSAIGSGRATKRQPWNPGERICCSCSHTL